MSFLFHRLHRHTPIGPCHYHVACWHHLDWPKGQLLPVHLQQGYTVKHVSEHVHQLPFSILLSEQQNIHTTLPVLPSLRTWAFNAMALIPSAWLLKLLLYPRPPPPTLCTVPVCNNQTEGIMLTLPSGCETCLCRVSPTRPLSLVVWAVY